MSVIITICQNKGGVGKTTTTSNIAYILSEASKVLLIDADSQGNLSSLFRVNATKDLGSVIDDKNNDPSSYIIKTSYKNIDIIPNNSKFNEWKVSANTRSFSVLSLSRFLVKIKDQYDYILIDTSPALDISLDMCISASDYYIIVTNIDYFCISGIIDIQNHILQLCENDIREESKRAKELGILINKLKKNTISKNLLEDFENDNNVFSTKIRESIDIVKNQFLSKTFNNKKNGVGLDYISVVDEIKARVLSWEKMDS